MQHTEIKRAFDYGAFRRSSVVLQIGKRVGQLLKLGVQCFTSRTLDGVVLGPSLGFRLHTKFNSQHPVLKQRFTIFYRLPGEEG